MIRTQEVIQRTNSFSATFCWKSANKGSSSTDIYGCSFHSLSVWHNFCNAMSSETACRPPRTTGGLRTIVWETQSYMLSQRQYFQPLSPLLPSSSLVLLLPHPAIFRPLILHPFYSYWRYGLIPDQTSRIVRRKIQVVEHIVTYLA